MMIARLKVLMKELGEDFDIDAPPEPKDSTNEKTDSNHNSLPGIADELLASTPENPLPGSFDRRFNQHYSKRIDTTKTTGVHEGTTITSR